MEAEAPPSAAESTAAQPAIGQASQASQTSQASQASQTSQTSQTSQMTAAAWAIGLWTIPGAMYSLETAYAWALDGAGRPLWRAALYQMPSWYVWAVLMYPLMRLARAFPLSRGRWLRSLPVHAAACLGVAACYATAKSALALIFW